MKQHFEIEGEQELNKNIIEDFGKGDEIIIRGIKVNGRDMDLVIEGRSSVNEFDDNDEDGFNLRLINKEGLQTRELNLYCYNGKIKFQESYDDGISSIINSSSSTTYYTGELETQNKHPGEDQVEIPVPHFHDWELKG